MAKRLSNLLMWAIPHCPSWNWTKRLMAINHKLMLRYGEFFPEYGFVDKNKALTVPPKDAP